MVVILSPKKFVYDMNASGYARENQLIAVAARLSSCASAFAK
jgi:hypothetical protein